MVMTTKDSVALTTNSSEFSLQCQAELPTEQGQKIGDGGNYDSAGAADCAKNGDQQQQPGAGR
jgi:hypothetical protein